MSKFKLTPEDVALLKEWGEYDEGIKQIEKAASEKYTKYTLIDTASEINNPLPVSRDWVIDYLGRETWLSGLHRSAFHFNALRYRSQEEQKYIYFDSSKLFK